MNTQLKKGDRFTSEFGSGEILGVDQYGSGGQVADAKLDDGRTICVDPAFLTRIPSKAERMQKMVDTAMDCENRLEPHETVQFTVEAFVEFARHYYEMQQELLECVNYYKSNAKSSLVVAESIEKLLKGETTK